MQRLLLLIFSLSFLQVRGDVIDSLENQLTKEGQTERRIEILNYLGFDYAVIDPAKAITYLHESADLAEWLNLPRKYAEALAYLGYNYRITGNYEEALNNSFEVLKLAEDLNDPQFQDFAYSNIGLVFDNLAQYPESLKYHNLALNTPGTLMNRGHNLNNIGNVFLGMEEWDSTLYYYRMALAIRLEIDQIEGIAESYNNIGEVHRKRGDLDSATHYYEQSLTLSEELDDQNGIVMTTMNIGATQLAKGDSEGALKNLSFAYDKARKLSFKNWEIETLTYLSELAIQEKNYELALRYYQEYSTQKDSLLTIEKDREIRLIESDFKRQEQEKELQLLRAESELNSLTRNSLIGGVVVLVIVFGLIVSRQRIKASADKKLATARETELRKELEYHSKSLSNHTLSMIQKNSMLEELKEEAKQLRDSLDDVYVKKLNSINRLIDHTINVDEDWKQFEMYFENVHNDFFKKLKEKHQGLTPSDMRLCALVKLNLNIKESATILGISPDSVKIARYRLRKKLQLDNEQSLADAILI